MALLSLRTSSVCSLTSVNSMSVVMVKPGLNSEERDASILVKLNPITFMVLLGEGWF